MEKNSETADLNEEKKSLTLLNIEYKTIKFSFWLFKSSLTSDTQDHRLLFSSKLLLTDVHF